MTQDYQQSWIELLHQKPEHAFRLLAFELTAHLTSVHGYAQLLAVELDSGNAESLKVETLQEFTDEILKSAERATNLLTELRIELRQQWNIQEGHSHD